MKLRALKKRQRIQNACGALVSSGNGISREQLEIVSGGDCDFSSGEVNVCHGGGSHDWKYTGQSRPGTIFGSLWPDYLHKCTKCGETEWFWSKLDD